MATPTLQIPQDVIEPIIKAEITKAIVEAMGPRAQLLQNAIAGLLNMKVDEKGSPSSYGSSRPWIDWMIGSQIRNAAEEAIKQHIAEHGDQLKKQLAAELQKRNSPLVRQLIEGMVGAMTHPDALKWRLNVTFDERR